MAEMIVGSYVLAGKVSLLFSRIMKKVLPNYEESGPLPCTLDDVFWLAK